MNQRLKSIVLEQIRFREQTNQWISQRGFDKEFPGPEQFIAKFSSFIISFNRPPNVNMQIAGVAN